MIYCALSTVCAGVTYNT